MSEHDVRHEPVSLVAHDVHLAYDQRRVVHGVDLAVPPGRVTVIVGANGCGKSTLLRGLGRILRPVDGHVELEGEDLRRMRPRQVAAVPAQASAVPSTITETRTSSGRRPRLAACSSPSSSRSSGRATSATSGTSTTRATASTPTSGQVFCDRLPESQSSAV